MLSVSRTESIQILRLHAWGTDPQLSMPMAQRYFFFIQNIGAYHLVRAPLVSFVRLMCDTQHLTNMRGLTECLMLLRWHS
jgi:hypothetical protein